MGGSQRYCFNGRYCFSSDTCNIMLGEKCECSNPSYDSFVSRYHNKCSCHMMHLSSSCTCLMMSTFLEQLYRNIYAHLTDQLFSSYFIYSHKLAELHPHKILTCYQTRCFLWKITWLEYYTNGQHCSFISLIMCPTVKTCHTQQIPSSRDSK